MSVHHCEVAGRYVRIVTEFVYPPIPDRSCDWSACDDNRYDGESSKYLAYGPTEAEAIEELLAKLAEDE